MCGITGIITRDKISEENRSAVRRMNRALLHRGPNSEGEFAFDHILAAMRRLSIIDLAGGGQPLWNEDKTIALVVNGEIYNFVELREELVRAGHTFSTNGDCETIIHAYEEYGDQFIQKLRGMFAFCLYDTKRHRVILARDRLGEKPIYLYRTDSTLAFSSEFKSLITLVDAKDRVLDNDSINLYFHYQYIPEPLTMIKGITKLPRGTMLCIDTNTFSIEEKKYWDIDAGTTPATDPVKEVRSQLDNIEKIIIRSDVPIGVCLSGGIDSSLIAILSQKYSDKKIHAFSIGYPHNDENDERSHAAKLATDLSLNFHSIEISKEDFSRDFDELVKAMDDPIADIAGYGYYRLSKAARSLNVPVLFAGFGGDELFWGYQWVVDSVRYNQLKQRVFGRFSLLAKLLSRFKSSIKHSPFTVLGSILKMSFGNGYIFYELTPGFFATQIGHRKIFSSNFRNSISKHLPSSFFDSIQKNNPEISSCVALYDLWMTGNCIPLGDRLSMAFCVEMRLPLLDYRLIEETIALRKKFPGDYTYGYKHWLIKAIRDIVPDEILTRKKRGFTPPTTAWITQVINDRKDDLVSGYLVQHGIINKNFVENTLLDIRKHKDFLYKMVVLESWIASYLTE